jgi:hypothetical protein
MRTMSAVLDSLELSKFSNLDVIFPAEFLTITNHI